MSSMSSSIARYESFLIHNVTTISSLESSLRSITWFLPGRFKDAELASEALTALLNVTSLYHDTVLAKMMNNASYRPLIPISFHNRYTKAWSQKSNLYKWAARTLEIIKFTQLVIEMGMRRRVSGQTRWRSVILLEAIKTTLRLILLRITRRPLVSSPIPEREYDPASLEPITNSSSPTLTASLTGASPSGTPDHLRNNRSPLPLHSLFTAKENENVPSDALIKEFLLPKALTTSSVKPSLSLLKPLSSPREWLSEVVYIIRPLVYSSMIVNDRRSNRALVTVLFMEFFLRNIRRTPSSNAVLERGEYARRDRDMVWYLLRGAIWETYTRPKLESILDKTASLPLLGLFGSLIKDWMPLIDEYYYYTSL